MKKIINGKLYDTDTARLIGSHSYGNSSNFSYKHEALYQKKTGELFLFGEGGPMSSYARDLGDNSWGYGETIIPEDVFDMEGIDVKEWVSKYCDVDTYIELFGDISE